MPNYDVIIIGSGIAALTAAYQLCANKNVIIITKSKGENSNSMLAQGGIASCIGEGDNWHSHYLDTTVAGCHHNNDESVELLVKTGPNYINNLIKDGMKFDTDEQQQLLLGIEGAHSFRRILHAGGDATGRELVLHMLNKVKNKVQIIENEFIVDLIMEEERCCGVISKTKDETVKHYFGSHIILATGGCGGLYSFTSNDESITGDGLAIAYRAGAVLTDIEFIQFHPTLLNSNGKGVGLVSEAVRGEGAILVTGTGRPIMMGKHPLQDLAPRDIVSRELFREMSDGESIYLDISMIDNFKEKFPTITNLCKLHGIEIESGRIPVIPGAHFLMGGIKTDLKGRTSIDGLYAIGEVACTGVHGANRLASNSLLEGIVFGNIVADEIHSLPSQMHALYSPNMEQGEQIQNLNLPSKTDIQQLMMENVGIVRNGSSLQFAVDWLDSYRSRLVEINLSKCTKEQIMLINMVLTSWLIATSALKRTESRGGHYREDFPHPDNQNWYKQEVIRTNRKSKVII